MAAPTPVSVTQTHFPALTANPVLDLDDATVAGDRTVVFAFLGRSRPLGVTWPSPWTEAVDINNTNGNTMITTIGWVDHAGPATSVQLTTVSTHAVWAQAFRFAAGSFDPASPPVFATAINSGNPPLLDPPWGVEEWLAFATLTRDGALGTVTFPFPNNQLSTNAGIFGSAALCTGPINADSVDPAQWVATTVGAVVTAGLRGPAAAEPVTGTLALTLPAMAGSLTGSATAEGELVAALPAAAAGFAGEAQTDGVVAGQLPAMGMAAAGVAGTGAELAGQLPAMAMSAAAEAAADGALAGVLPALALSMEGLVEEGSGASLGLVLPAMTGTVEGNAHTEGEIAGALPALTLAITGGREMAPLCEPWPLPPSGCPTLDGPFADYATMAASEVLWAMSGRRFGTCSLTIRPCRSGCGPTPAWMWWRSGWPWPSWPPLGAATWWNAACGSCRVGCSCNDADTLVLPELVQSVTQVLIDGVELPEGSGWLLYSDGGSSLLVRADGQRWPLCQDWTVPVSGQGAWAITAVVGEPVPMLGRLALGELASQIVAGCAADGSCQLPAFTTEVSRQGITQRFPTFIEIMEAGVVGVGLATVDLFLRTTNPNSLMERPRFYNPDDWASRPRVEGGAYG